jgi:hypothetical protein
LSAGYVLSTNDQGGSDAMDSDADPLTAKTPVINLSAGENDMTWDAGINNPAAPIGALGNYVWYDQDKDGLQDPNETGVPGVTVTLYNASSTPIRSAITDQNGFYSFPNLAPGSYMVGFSTLPPNRGFTIPDAGGDDATDSDVSTNIVLGAGDIPLSGNIPFVTLVAGEYNPTLDAGLVVQLPTSVTMLQANAILQGNVTKVS